MEIIPIKHLPILQHSDYGKTLSFFLRHSIEQGNFPTLQPGDILTISHTFLAKLYGPIKDINTLTPTTTAENLAPLVHKSPQLVQLILEESQSVVRAEHVIITKNQAGIIGTNAGVDKSNVPGRGQYACIPPDPDGLAAQIQMELVCLFQRKIPILITDSVGRPFRNGSVGIALGAIDVPILVNQRGIKDLYGHTLHSTEVAVADMLASAADVVMGQTNEGIPIVIIRGWEPPECALNTQYAAELIRDSGRDMFQKRDWEDVITFRRSYKASEYAAKKVSPKILRKILQLACYAPNAHNRQGWQFIDVSQSTLKTKLIKQMATLWKQDLEKDNVDAQKITQLLHSSQKKFESAPILMLLCYDEKTQENYSDPRRQESERVLLVQSVAAAATTFLLALEGFGLVGNWHSAGVFAAPAIKELLTLPPSWSPQLLITAGYPIKRDWTSPIRRDLSEFVSEIDAKEGTLKQHSMFLKKKKREKHGKK